MPREQHQPQRLPLLRTPSPSSPPPFSASWYAHHCSQRFFSSLRQVEERLASENGCSSGRAPDAPASPPPQPQRGRQKHPDSSLLTSSEKFGEPHSPPSPSPSYSAPLFVDPHGCRLPRPHLADGSKGDPLPPDSSDPPPLELFSDSILPESPPSCPVESGPARPPEDDAAGNLEDDVARLVELLGLSGLHQERGAGDGDGEGFHGCWSGSGGDQDDAFLSRVAGVKGPKCRREMERLDGWIRCYSGGGSQANREPARLAHMLLARAICTSRGGGGDDGGFDSFGGLGFPATVGEYLLHDPPAHASPPLP